MEQRTEIPEQLRSELTKLLGEEKADALIEEKQGDVAKLQTAYFVKKFRKQFGIDIRIVAYTFLAIFALYGLLRLLNG